ncbi:hypothetical protein [Paenibacillus sp. y28]|uniref:hypothetical protein n=1 Tax=Paenibacillus sp. y28 TaxID=3129110 RepID=UPI0030190F57
MKDEQPQATGKPGLLLFYWKTSTYHIVLLSALVLYLVVYTKPWMVVYDFTALFSRLAAQFLLGFVEGITLFIPLILAVLLILLVLRRQRVKVLAILSGIVMLLYWLVPFAVLLLGQSLLSYSMSFSFYLIPAAALIILATAILMPERRMIEQDQYRILQKEIRLKKYNLFILGMNALLLILMLAFPAVQFTDEIRTVLKTGRPIHQLVSGTLSLDFDVNALFLKLKLGITVMNGLIKIIPAVFTVIYFMKHVRSNEDVPLNKTATIYVLYTFVALWYSTQFLNKIIVVSNFYYLCAGISALLILLRFLVYVPVPGSVAAAWDQSRTAARRLQQRSVSAWKRFFPGTKDGDSQGQDSPPLI